MSESQKQMSEKMKDRIRKLLLETKTGGNSVHTTASKALHEWLSGGDVQSTQFAQPHDERLSADKKPD
jgi:hypothetical protein